MMPEPNLLESIESHRSIRRYRPEPIPSENVQRMQRAAQKASSGGAAQFYSFIRVTDPKLRQRISEWTGQPFVGSAAEFFIACADFHRMRLLLQSRGEELSMPPIISLIYGTMDAVLAASNLATAAEAMGYGICFIGAIQRVMDVLIDELLLPEGVFPVVGLCVGIPDEEPPSSPRLPTDLVFHQNVYRKLTEEDLSHCFDAMAAVRHFGGWFNYLTHFFTKGREFERREGLWRKTLNRQGFKWKAD